MADLPSVSWLAEITRFDPPKTLAPPPDWDEAVQMLAYQGLSSIAAYNLQYRMPLTEAPDFAKDLLLGYMQGLVSDNVFKMVTLKQMIGELEGVKAVLLDGASFAEALYPHIGFRAVPELRILTRRQDVVALEEAMREEQFVEVEGEEPDPDKPAATLYNDKFYVKLYVAEDPGIIERAVPARAYGLNVMRPAAEDALLLAVVSMARRGFAVPLIQFVDLRELVKGESPTGMREGPGMPIDPAVLAQRAKAAGAERALYAAMELLAHYHPDVAEAAGMLKPSLAAPTRMLIDSTVVAPAKDPSRGRQLKAVEKLVKLLF